MSNDYTSLVAKALNDQEDAAYDHHTASITAAIETYDHYLQRAAEAQNTDVLRRLEERKRQHRRAMIRDGLLVAAIWALLALAVVLR